MPGETGKPPMAILSIFSSMRVSSKVPIVIFVSSRQRIVRSQKPPYLSTTILDNQLNQIPDDRAHLVGGVSVLPRRIVYDINAEPPADDDNNRNLRPPRHPLISCLSISRRYELSSFRFGCFDARRASFCVP